MKIVVLKYGESVFGENYIFKGGAKDVMLPISFVFYLIQTKDKNILVDVGCDDGAGFDMSIFKKPVEVLSDYGLSPEDITDVIITHSHHDHIEALHYYKNATIHIHKNEYESGKPYIPDGFNVNIFQKDYTIDEDITIKEIAGHSYGSCIVIVKNYVLCGDECYYKKCLTDHIPTGASYASEKNSLDFVMEYSKDKYIPLLFHDPDILTGSIGYEEITK